MKYWNFIKERLDDIDPLKGYLAIVKLSTPNIFETTEAIEFIKNTFKKEVRQQVESLINSGSIKNSKEIELFVVGGVTNSMLWWLRDQYFEDSPRWCAYPSVLFNIGAVHLVPDDKAAFSSELTLLFHKMTPTIMPCQRCREIRYMQEGKDICNYCIKQLGEN